MIDVPSDSIGIAPYARPELDGVIHHVLGPWLVVVIVDGAVENGDDFAFADRFDGKHTFAKLFSFTDANFRIVHSLGIVALNCHWRQTLNRQRGPILNMET